MAHTQLCCIICIKYNVVKEGFELGYIKIFFAYIVTVAYKVSYLSRKWLACKIPKITQICNARLYL